MLVEPGQQAAAAVTPLVMGIVNVTPDSFSDGGDLGSVSAAVDRALALIDEGADWIDVGGESTRPGAAPVEPAEELRRVVPVVRGIVTARRAAVVSVDTRRESVARAAIEAGARIVNDVTGLDDPGMRKLCAEAGVTCVVMHMRGQPATMQQQTQYEDLVGEVRAYLAEQAAAALASGVRRDRIVVDPGVGFGKARGDNPSLIAATPRFAELGYPVLIGASRKSFVGALTGREVPRDRVAGSVGAALAAAAKGAKVLRVHDVAATRDALAVFMPCMAPSSGGRPA